MLLSLFLQTALLAPTANTGALLDLGALLEPLAAAAVGVEPDLAAATPPRKTMVLTLLHMLCKL